MSKSKPKRDLSVPEQVHALFATVCEEYATLAEDLVGRTTAPTELKKATAGIARKVTQWKKKLEAVYPVNSATQPTLPGMEAEAAPEPAAGKVEAPPPPPPPPVVPPDPPDEKIEFQVDVTASLLKDLTERAEALGVLLGRRHVDTATDAQGSTIYFEYDTVIEALTADARVRLQKLPYVVETTVVDPAEERLSEGELAGLDAAPRRLVELRVEKTDDRVTRCTRCVELGHVPEASVVTAAAPGPACEFCGWDEGG